MTVVPSITMQPFCHYHNTVLVQYCTITSFWPPNIRTQGKDWINQELNLVNTWGLGDAVSLSTTRVWFCSWQINLIAPPRYVMTTTTLERTEGLSVLNQAMAAIKEKIEEKRGVFNIQMEVSDPSYFVHPCKCKSIYVRSEQTLQQFTAGSISSFVFNYVQMIKLWRSASAQGGDGHGWDRARPAAGEARAGERRGGRRWWRRGDGGKNRGLELVVPEGWW